VSSEELERIRRSQRNTAPHIQERQTWQNTEALIAALDAALARVKELEALKRDSMNNEMKLYEQHVPDYVLRAITGGGVP